LPDPVLTGSRTGLPAAARRPLLPDLSATNAGLLGLFSVAAILLGSLAAAIAYVGPAGETYSPFNHFISELGHTSQSRLSIVFDAGVVIGGLGLGFFLPTLALHLTGRYRPALTIAGIVAGTSGSLVGIFSMDTHAVHRLVSAVFFCTGWVVAAIFSVWLARHRGVLPRRLLVPGAVSIAVFWIFLAVYSTYRPLDPNAPILVRPVVWTVPLLEWAALLSLLVWFGCVSLALLADRQWPAPKP
jgi:hypothetical membrane protein